MFVISYLFHGVFLTDYSRLSSPKGMFLFVSAIAYILIGFLVAKSVGLPFISEKFNKNPLLQGVIGGAICGFSIFLTSLVIGISFDTKTDFKNLILDVSWQMIEQIIGGITFCLVQKFIYEPNANFKD
jgi:H+/Cl- antiporter ClcA